MIPENTLESPFPLPFCISVRELVHSGRFNGLHSRLTAGPQLHSEASHSTCISTITANNTAGKFAITKAKSYHSEYPLSDTHPNTFKLPHQQGSLDLVPAGTRMHHRAGRKALAGMV